MPGIRFCIQRKKEAQNMSLTKATLRKECLEKFRQLARHNKPYNDEKLAYKLVRELERRKAKRILVYWPLVIEPDIRKAILALRRTKELYLPFMEDVSFKMVPFRLPLTPNKFGIFEAGNTIRNIKKIDVAIVPAVGVDAQARRIGFGKGMYDRFFAKLKKRPFIIFVQSEHCYTDERVCDDYDISADLLLTPRAAYSAARIKNVKRNTLRRRHRHAKRSNRFFYS
jgi:5-formyltetrahydrofolate cyclo-ligase